MHFTLPSVLLALVAATSVAANHHHTDFARAIAPKEAVIARRSEPCEASSSKREKRMHKRSRAKLGRRGGPNRQNFAQGGNGGNRSAGSPPSDQKGDWSSSFSDSQQESSSSAESNVRSTSSAQAAAYTTTTQHSQATTSSAVAASTSSSSSSSSSYSGEATFFYQGGVAGACGSVHSDSDKVVALMSTLYGDTGSESDYCGKTVVITNTANGESVTATVADACPSCTSEYSLDLSVGAFTSIGDEDTGVLDITWYFSD